MLAGRWQRAFTLIELLVTLALVAVLLKVATPSFVQFQRNSELLAMSQTLLASLNAARSEAMKRGGTAMIVPMDQKQWESGWIVFVKVDAIDVKIHEQKALPDYISVLGNSTAAANPPYILYDAVGYSKQKNGAFAALKITFSRNDVNASQATSEIRRVIIDSTGRARTCKPTSDTDPSCPSS
jgi:type IV fimbrial biogenesis protein FimT